MSRKPVFDSILSGLNEALEDAKKETPALKRHRITVIPLKVYEANDIKKIRTSTGLSQKYFASYMGVSIKTVEAWEAGINQPSGSSSRLLHMMELDNELIEKYPFFPKLPPPNPLRHGKKASFSHDKTRSIPSFPSTLIRLHQFFLPPTLTPRRKSIYCKKLPPFTTNVI